MARNLPFRQPGACIDCGTAMPKRMPGSWRCWPCARAVIRVQSSAISKVKRAILRGELPKPHDTVCVDCGRKAHEYDHRDYSRPLDVQPVCGICNKRRGPAAWTRPQYREAA